jgi:NAD(P)-dependent dehydrogenase (short-subunit alcohol dehydrogenase family)
MNGRLLITGRESELGALIVRKLLDQGLSVTSTESNDSIPLVDSDGNPYAKFRGISWNSRSPLSARNVVLKLINEKSEVDTALVVLPTSVDNRPFHEVPSSAIDTSIDTEIKSHFFLVKEILSFFQKRGNGRLVFILYKGGTDALPPVSAAVYGCLHDFVSSLFVFYQNERVKLLGYESNTPYPEEFAEYIVRDMSEMNGIGRWQKHGSRSSILENLPFSLKRRS